MLPIKIIFFILLLFRLGSDALIILVIRRQLQLLRTPIEKELRHFRLVLFYLSIGIFVGNLVPIIIDVLTLFIPLNRFSQVSPIGILYTISNAMTALASSYLIWKLYRLAADTKAITDYEIKQLHQNT